MTERQDEIRALDALESLSKHRLAELRAASMHAIRFELVVRLLRAALRVDTVSIFWDHDAAFMRERKMGEASWRLVLGRGRRITVEFPDLWVLRYPDDAEVKHSVEAALDRMLQEVRGQGADEPRARDPFPPAARARPATDPLFTPDRRT